MINTVIMLFGIVTLLSALALAATAAWFAVEGIVSVFAGAVIPALIMGVVIELGKVVSVSWLYRNWNEPTKIKYALIPITIVAMALTSMGIFGFLSKAHIEQNAPVGNNTLQIERLDQRIVREQARITDAETVIAQLDQTVSTLIQFEKISGPDGARAVRAGQQEQRDILADQIREAQTLIDQYEDEKLTLNQELRSLELEVGPIKYIAELIYEDPQTNLENAVRIVIIAFIFIFDPMAIILLMAANYTLMSRRPPPLAKVDPEPAQAVQSSVTEEPQVVASPTVEPEETTPPPARTGKFVHNDRQGKKFKPIT